MSETANTNERQRLRAAPADVLRALPAMDRVMVVASAPGLLHERIGTVSAVDDGDGDRLSLSGDGHDCTVDKAAIAAVVVDRSGRMRDQVMPKLEFLDAGGTALFTIVGMAGAAPFDAALAPFADGAAPEPARISAGAEPRADDDALNGDPGLAALQQACESGGAVDIALATPGLTQRWRGTIDQVRPMMGNANIIMRDFHLHLRAGAVGAWRSEADGSQMALTADGGDLGLSLRQPADA